jgi:hypothetical protein
MRRRMIEGILTHYQNRTKFRLMVESRAAWPTEHYQFIEYGVEGQIYSGAEEEAIQLLMRKCEKHSLS